MTSRASFFSSNNSQELQVLQGGTVKSQVLPRGYSEITSTDKGLQWNHKYWQGATMISKIK